MAAAAELRGDAAHVHIALGPEAHLHLGTALPEEAGHADRVDRARVVHELLGLDEALRHETRWQAEPRDPAVVADRDAREHLAEPAQALGGPALVERGGDSRGI